MKRILVSFIAVMLGMVGFSQSVIIHFKDGSFEKHKMSLIESIEFVEDDYDTSASIYLEKAGTLSSKLSKSQASELLKLKLSGHMDARDFDYIKWDCMKIEEVDLSDVVIDSYSGVEGTEEGNNKTYAANEIPSGAFFYWKDCHKYNYDGMPIEEGMVTLKKVVLPQGITAIRRNAFARAYNLTEINIPEGVQSIDLVAFNICTSLEEVRLPSTLLTVGYMAFGTMHKLKRVYISATTPPSAYANAFDLKPSDAVLYVPKGTENKYRNAVGWNTFTSIIEIGDTPSDNTNDDFGKVADVVDLGLSVKWASWNIGASDIGEYGGLYGMGDATGTNTSEVPTDYYYNETESLCGTEYDLATVKWGKDWRLPTKQELIELRDKCTWEHNVKRGDIYGSVATGPNGNTLFLPYSGCRHGSNSILDRGFRASIWSGEPDASKYAYGYMDLDICNNGLKRMDGSRNWAGQSIRPVYVGESTNTNNEEGWQIITDDFDKSISFTKIRVLNKKASIGSYCCIAFSTVPNENVDTDRYYVSFGVLAIGDNMIHDLVHGIPISSCTYVGDNWYEYEFSRPVYFAYYQENCPRGQVMAYIENNGGGGDDEDDDIGGGDYDVTEYCQVFINGEDCSTEFYVGTIGALEKKELNGTTVRPYGIMTEQIKISQYDGLQFHIVAGYGSEYLETIYPHEKGTYQVISNRGEYVVTDYPDNIGMVISGGNMKYRTVTSGSLKITKVTKVKNESTKMVYGRDYDYISEGTFDFILTDDWDGNENKISGKFRLVI